MNAPLKRKPRSFWSRAWARIRQSKLKIFIPIIVIAGGLVLLFPNEHNGLGGGRCRADAGPEVNWAECKKRMLMLKDSNFENAKMAEADFSNSDFSRSKLTAADLTKAAIIRTSFVKADLTRAVLAKAEGYRSDFAGVVAKDTNFGMAEMQRANFTDADLMGANFTKAELGRAVFNKSEMGSTQFAKANLARASFKNVSMKGPVDFADAFLFLTRFEGVDLSQATGIRQEQLALACGNSKTLLPQGLTAPQEWPCEED